MLTVGLFTPVVIAGAVFVACFNVVVAVMQSFRDITNLKERR